MLGLAFSKITGDEMHIPILMLQNVKLIKYLCLPMTPNQRLWKDKEQKIVVCLVLQTYMAGQSHKAWGTEKSKHIFEKLFKR